MSSDLTEAQKNDARSAAFMLECLGQEVGKAIINIDTTHDGLSKADRETLAIMRSLLQGVEDKALEMAQGLRIASYKPLKTEG